MVTLDEIEKQIAEQKKTVDYDTREFTIEYIVNKYLENIDTDDNEIFVPDYDALSRGFRTGWYIYLVFLLF